MNRITAERERDMFSLFCDDERENEEVAGEKKKKHKKLNIQKQLNCISSMSLFLVSFTKWKERILVGT